LPFNFPLFYRSRWNFINKRENFSRSYDLQYALRLKIQLGDILLQVER